MKKIVVVTKGKAAPSFRYRLAPLISALERKGHECHIETFDSTTYFWRIWKHRDLYKNASCVILHKLLLPKIETLLVCHLNKSVILDIDDAIYLKEPKWVGHIRPISRTRESKFQYLVSKCQLIVTGNQELEKKVKSFTDKTKILPTGIDTNKHLKATNENAHTCNIVWIGLPSNLRYLETLHSTFTTLSKKHPHFVLRIICSQFPDWQDVKLEKIEWSTEIEKQTLIDSDIGIMPLDNSEYSKGKCAFKLLQYMSARLPCVASPVGANREIVKNGVNGYLASTEEEWLEKLSALIENPALRKEMGEEGEKISLDQYNQSNIANKYAELIIETIGETQ